MVLARTDQGEESELARDEARRRGRLVAMTERPTKITFGEMRDMGVRGVLIYCSDYKCSHSIAVNADRRPDDVRLSNIEERFVGSACGKRGADVRPDFNWNRQPMGMMGFR